MHIEDIKKVIADQKEEIDLIFRREKIIERQVPRERLLKFLTHPNVLVITGVRRCGKSILSSALLRGRPCGYVNFDDERLSGMEGRDLDKTLQAFHELSGPDLDCFIFDEIQDIPLWELFISRLRRTKKVIVTGSNAKLLSGELSTHLTGRYVDFVLMPFSFREFMEFKGLAPRKEDLYSSRGIAHTRALLEEYIELGGFPEAYKFGKAIIGRIYSDIITKDILLRHKIRNAAAFKELARYLVSNFGCEQSYNKLKNVFSLKDTHTAANYVGYLISSHIILMLTRFSPKLKQQVIAPKKVYCIDTGIINSLAFQASENRGRLIENLVAIELHRRKHYFNEETEIYYWKDHQGREVDFVLKEGSPASTDLSGTGSPSPKAEGRRVKQLIQICLHMQGMPVKEREIKALLKAGRELGCGNMLVITWDEEGEEKAGPETVRFVPLWKWLLN